MENCAFMQEMISRMLDEELNPEEQAALAEHLAVCPECRTMYQAFAAVSDTLRGDLAEPPEALRENVMAELRREQIRKRNLRPWRAVLSAAAVAALALGLRYGLPALTPKNTMTAARQVEDTAATMLYAASVEGLQTNGAAVRAESPEEAKEEAALFETADAAHVEESAEAEFAAAAPAAPVQENAAASRSAAASAGGALADAALPVYDLSGTLELAALPEALRAGTAETDPDRLGEPAGTILASDGSLTLYAYEGALYFLSPADGTPLRCGLSAAELESLAG
jgi:hypothetical protein